MQGALLTAKGRAVGCEFPRREWSSPGFKDFAAVRSKSLRMSSPRVGCCGLVVMKTNQQLARIAGGGWLGSSLKARSVRVHASGEDLEDVAPLKPQVQSSGTVLPYVGVACLGAILFGYHLGRKDLVEGGFTEGIGVK